MREFRACLRTAFRRLFLLDLPAETDEDEVSKAAFRQWVASSKHPDACRVGCQCRLERR